MNYRFSKEELDHMSGLIHTLCKGLMNLYATEDRRQEMINQLDIMCGDWECTSSNTRFVIYKENTDYKLLFIKKRGLFRRLTMETYHIYQDSGWPYFNTGIIFTEPQHLVYNHDNDFIMLPNEAYKRIGHINNMEEEPIVDFPEHQTMPVE